MNFPRMTRLTAGLAGLLASASALATTALPEPSEPQRWQLNMTAGVTATSQNAYNGHMLMLWMGTVRPLNLDVLTEGQSAFDL